MIGYLSGIFLGADEGNSILLDVSGVGYSVLVSSRATSGVAIGSPFKLFIHTNLCENALELFGFSSVWEKRVFLALTSVSGVGPRTAIAVLGNLDGETILAAIVREDRVTLTSVSGIGKKTAERLIVELGEKARKLLSERPNKGAVTSAPIATLSDAKKSSAKTSANIPAQGASAKDISGLSGLDVADLWNEALAALLNLGYRDAEAIAAIKIASAKLAEAGTNASIEKLVMSSLQLLSRGI